MVLQTVKKTEKITVAQSLVLVKNMFRAAISSIAFVRGYLAGTIFQEREIVGVKYPKMINGNPQVKRFIDWLEFGVFDALKEKYLDIFFLEVRSSEDGAESGQLLECFSFRVDYPQSGAEFLLATHDAPNPTTSEEIVTENLRQVLRTLMAFIRKVPPLPHAHRVSMRLLYKSDAPNAYEPPMFRAAKQDEKSWFSGSPHRVVVKTLTTPHHIITIEYVGDV